MPAVLAAIGAEAEAKVAAVEAEAAAALARADAAVPAPGAGGEVRRARLEAAHRAATERLAHEDWLDVREGIEARAAWIERAVAAGWARLAGMLDPAPERIFRLAAEALPRLPGDEAEVVVREEDAAALDAAFAARLAAATGKRAVRIVEGEADGGCRVRVAGGRITFDNTFAARAKRLEPVWRTALVERYAR